ncbi:hypothetical protein [Chachezhania sediminis]|uniref:hypothetical protein n=1 Tax=Chachezhania sediminis TaxID=2599291 RepID=UPI00131ACDC2|nr:hypothetical protein [Chachezhania sediminis]
MNLAVQAAPIAGQHIIFSPGAGIRARVTTLFMGSMFLDGATGSAIAGTAHHIGGWSFMCLAGPGFAPLGTATHLWWNRPDRRHRLPGAGCSILPRQPACPTRPAAHPPHPGRIPGQAAHRVGESFLLYRLPIQYNHWTIIYGR